MPKAIGQEVMGKMIFLNFSFFKSLLFNNFAPKYEIHGLKAPILFFLGAG